MTGRGVDQILPHSVRPKLHEPRVRNARRYVRLAEAASGPIPKSVGFDYIWGDAIRELERAAPDLRVINLETAVTTSRDWWRGKKIHYRMHPRNTPILNAAHVDCCVLANNHVLDWGYAGLEETLTSLRRANVAIAGAGRNLEEARQPAVLETPRGKRVLLFAAGSRSSGIPAEWAAASDRPGVYMIDEASPDTAAELRRFIEEHRRDGDRIVVSLHWSPNWNYRVPEAERRLAHALISEAGVDVVHGHSSHHIKGIEVYENRPILYGCGDLLTDYEGIGKRFARFRGDLGSMYFVDLEAETGILRRLEMIPTEMNRIQIRTADRGGSAWLAEVLNREGRRFGTGVELLHGGALELTW